MLGTVFKGLGELARGAVDLGEELIKDITDIPDKFVEGYNAKDVHTETQNIDTASNSTDTVVPDSSENLEEPKKETLQFTQQPTN